MAEAPSTRTPLREGHAERLDVGRREVTRVAPEDRILQHGEKIIGVARRQRGQPQPLGRQPHLIFGGKVGKHSPMLPALAGFETVVLGLIVPWRRARSDPEPVPSSGVR